MTRATNKDVLVFSVKGAIEAGRPVLRHVVKVQPISRSKNYASLFSLARQYDGGKGLWSKGWLYSFVGGDEASGFCAIGFDGSNSVFFNQLRVAGETISIEEGLCKAKYEPGAGRVVIRDERKTVVWRGMGPEYEVEITVGRGTDQLKLKYSFEKIKPEIGNYRCVFEKYGAVLSYWFISPMRGRLEISTRGDVARLGFPKLAALSGRVIESEFSYTECVHANVPFVSIGWSWNLLACQRTAAGIAPEKIVGFFDFFFSTPVSIIPLNYQLYAVDLKSGEFETFGEADVTLEGSEIPVLKVKNREGTLKLEIRNTTPGRKYAFKGRKIADLLSTAQVDYRAYPSRAKVTIHGRKYDAVGTSEFAGGPKNYWL